MGKFIPDAMLSGPMPKAYMQKSQIQLATVPEEQTEDPPAYSLQTTWDLQNTVVVGRKLLCLQQVLEIPSSPRKNNTISHFKGHTEQRKDA